MRRFSRLISLALLSVAGSGLAVTCSYDNVPGATLLVPYFKVSSNGVTDASQPIPPGGTNTLVAITNVSATGLIAHWTVWNKYSVPVIDFNVPLTAYDVAYWSVANILNMQLNMNDKWQNPNNSVKDVCFDSTRVGFGATKFIRFANPSGLVEFGVGSKYLVPAVPLNSAFRAQVLDSLDESGDIVGVKAPGAFVLDDDNAACGSDVDGEISGDFSGYITIDVVNYCNNLTPVQGPYYDFDAIATSGWSEYGYTPNALIGDVFYLNQNPSGGNVSGDQMVPLEFDTRLEQFEPQIASNKTFYGRYSDLAVDAETGSIHTGVPSNYYFWGDGREPLGERYGFRYNNQAGAVQSWALIWRSDIYVESGENLCEWWAEGGSPGDGFYDEGHQLIAFVFDSDENIFTPSGKPPCPSPPTPECLPGGGNYFFLEAGRLQILGNEELNPGKYPDGYIDMLLPGTEGYNMAWVGIQHSGEGLALSVGHSASLLDNQFLCSDYFFEGDGVGNRP